MARDDLELRDTGMDGGLTKLSGIVAEFNDERGFGFITPASRSGDLFFHVSAIRGNRDGITVGEAVRYEIGRDRKGRSEARYVWRRQPVQTGVLVAVSLSFSFLAGMALLAVVGRIPLWSIAYYAALSAVSFTLYASDKNRARLGRQRTPERILHLWDLLGGWPGGIIAQQGLRHKNRKRSFLWGTAMVVTAHLGVLAWLIW